MGWDLITALGAGAAAAYGTWRFSRGKPEQQIGGRPWLGPVIVGVGSAVGILILKGVGG